MDPSRRPSTTPPELPRRRRRRRVLGPLLLVTALVGGLVAVIIGLDSGQRRSESGSGFEVPGLRVAPHSAVPSVAPVAPGAARPTAAAVRDWAATVAEKTHIPIRSLVAYAEAELAIRSSEPGCKLSWVTLAGVGRVESRHGRYGGSDIGADGILSPPIIGVPLDGSRGVRAIRDTDGGRLDGDTTWDRAVGAMQFLPETWTRYGLRASGDGRAPDPQNIDDAALTAAKYLCRRGGDLSTASGWWTAVLAYNRSVAYGQDVFSGADAYAKAARQLA